MIKLSKFRLYKEAIENNLTNKPFRSRFLFESIYNENFLNRSLQYLKMLNSDLCSRNLDDLFNKIRKETIELYEKSIHENNLKDKLNLALESLAMFYLLESFDEYSTFSEKVVNEIKEKYKENYFTIISKLESSEYAEDELLKKYLVLKKWQDKQHIFYNNNYGEYIEKLQRKYLNDYKSNSFDLEHTVLRKRLFEKLDMYNILNLETCTIISALYINKYVVKYIGGKMYGLAKLNYYNILVPNTWVVPVNRKITCTDLSIFAKNKKYAIRSSADIEDGEKKSFAGMFDSYLNIPFVEIQDKIKLVKESVTSTRVNEYIKINNLSNPQMAVIIQEYVEPEISGVWIGNNEKEGILEWTVGNGEKLVSGKVQPNIEMWTENGNSENYIRINGKFIGSILVEIQNKLKINSDFEWMVLNNKLYLLQFRKVTKKLQLEKTSEKENSITGIAASQGVASGRVQYVKSLKDNFEKGNILLVECTDPNWLSNLLKAKAVISLHGGFLCHCAIICRELGIPCVTGINEKSFEKLINYKENVIVDGTKGVVTIK